MVRGSRAPSLSAYRGSLGQTRTDTVHVTGSDGDLIATTIYTTVDAVADPELIERLYGETLNVYREGAEDRAIAIPIVYHDPAAEVMVLVLADAHRHRELEERIALLAQLRDDGAPIPTYAKEFAVVFGARGLRTFLEKRAQSTLDSARSHETIRDNERRRADVSTREVDVDRRARELERRTIEHEAARSELASRTAELVTQMGEIERSRAELERLRSEARVRVIAAAQQMPVDGGSGKLLVEERTTIATPPESRRDDLETRPIPFSDVVLAAEDNDGDIVTSAATSALGRGDSEDFERVATGVSELAHRNGAARAHPGNTPLEQPGELDFDEETTGASIIPPGSDPLTTETTERPMVERGGDGKLEKLAADAGADAWLADAMRAPSSSFLVQGGRVRLALVAGDQVARGLGGNLDVRVLLYRTPDAPVVAVVVGPPAALRVPSTTQLVVVTLDIAREVDRHVLSTLAKRFVIDVDILSHGRRIRRVELVAPLADNVGYILRAADDHLRGVANDGEPSFDRACDRVLAPGFDLLGVTSDDASEFRDDKLAGLETASHLRRAIAVARRFARPSREDYLVCTRGFPLPRWRELRRHVLESAVTWGLWMGPELAQVAVSEGLARSRRDLVVRLEQGFELLRRHPTAFDIDAEAAADNASALAEEARALGVELRKSSPQSPPSAFVAASATPASRTGAIASDEATAVSGSIAGTPPHGLPPLSKVVASAPAITIINTPKALRSADDLMGLLDNREHRLGAAIELCDRGEGRAAQKIVDVVNKMSRADAVRVLGMSVKLGEAAKQPLIDGLGSSKAFLRHGCALALAMLRTEDGTQAVIDLLLSEPTEIWREVARAIGQVGPTALMPLASNMGRMGDRATPAIAERVAWAMAHVGVRGGKNALETMAGGQSVVAPVARTALELVESAARDEVRVRPAGQEPTRDVTVNRAFSRRFFESLEQGVPEAGQAELTALDASTQMEMLDENDLIEDLEDEAELDESDLIQQ